MTNWGFIDVDFSHGINICITPTGFLAQITLPETVDYDGVEADIMLYSPQGYKLQIFCPNVNSDSLFYQGTAVRYAQLSKSHDFIKLKAYKPAGSASKVVWRIINTYDFNISKYQSGDYYILDLNSATL